MRRIIPFVVGLVLCALALSPSISLAATWPNFKRGDSGTDVYTIQHLLVAHSLSLDVDGKFGPATEGAVKSFQAANGLEQDGVVGSNTWGKLIIVVKSGSKGEAVKGAQRQLNKYGYNLAVDGSFGPATDGATRDFQSKRGLAVDGSIGPNTWHALVSGGGGGGGTRAELAAQIRDSSRVSLLTVQVSGVRDNANAYQNIVDTAAGGQAKRSSYGNAPGGSVYLDTRMLQGMVKLAGSYTYRVTSIAGGSHSPTSRHYDGVAFDVDIINGQEVSSSNRHYRAFMQSCRALGADQVFGPGDSGHSSHVHCAWPR
jgi:peptidoglycan hydrolase-like protein with peptidoglycan-binding domain